MQELSPYSLPEGRRLGPPSGYRPPPAEEPGLRDYWIVVRRHLRLIGALFLGAVGLTALVVLNLTPIYTARSTLLIEPQAAPILDIKGMMSETQSSGDHDYYKTQYDVLRSRSLAAAVIGELDLAGQPPFSEDGRPKGLIAGWWSGLLEGARALLAAPAPPAGDADAPGVPSALIDDYLARLQIRPQFGTQLVEIAFGTPDPRLSARIVNAHVAAYIRRRMELKADAARSAEGFLQGKLAELKDRVEKSEAALNAYRREHGVIAFSLDEQGKGQMLQQRLADLNNTLAKVEAERITLEVQHEMVRRGQADALPTVMQSQLIQTLKQQVAQLAAEYAAMRNQFNPGYQPLNSLKAKLDQSRVQLSQEIDNAANEVESDYRAASAREQRLEQEIGGVKAQALALNDASLQDAVLVRQVDASRKLYQSVIERVRELDVSADAPASNVSVVDHAEPPRFPSSPKRLLSLELSALIGLAGGIGLAFLLEFLDDRLKSAEQIERELRLPSLALVPDFTKLTGRTGYGPRRLIGKQAARLLEARGGSGGAAAAAPPESRPLLGEIYHAIRTALLYSRAGEAPKTVLITSAVESEGKTSTAAGVAMAFAQTGGRVLLVDADLRKPRCHEVLGLENGAGLSDVLTGQARHEDAIRPTEAGLFFLSAGSSCPNPAALLGSAAMRDLLAGLCEAYDHVLLDSPPVMPVSDPATLATLVDGVLVVAGAATPKRVVRRACAQLMQVGATIFGVALNRVDTAGPDYHYYNPYKSYYRRDVA